MISISELDLPQLPMETPEFTRDPVSYFASARKEHPWLAKCAFGYVIHEFEAIRDLLWLDELQGSYTNVVEILGAKDTPWGRFQENHVLAQSGDAHKRLRNLLAPKFTPKQADQNRQIMRETISALLDQWAPKRAFDFEEFASYFPITVMCKMIGASPDVIPSLRNSLEALGLSASMDINHVPALQKATVILDEFVQNLVAERRAHQDGRDKPDLLDSLLDADGDRGLNDREIYDLLIFLFVAGYDTSKNVLTLIMNQMLQHPDQYRRCAEDLVYSRKVVEETLRYNNPATIPRIAVQNLVYRDVLLPKGTMVFFPVSVAGRDPTAVESPERFDPERENNRHLAFGRGPHMCLGQFIARAQIEEGLHLIAQRIKNPVRTGPSNWRPFFGVWGMKGLPIKFDA